jgi:streptogramin lyase
MTTKPRRQSAITALFVAAIAFLLALPAFASADPLGSGPVYYNSGLRENAFAMVVTEGPEGNVWFVDNQILTGTPLIGKITSSGTITEYTVSGLNAGSDLTAIATGPDGNLWITDRGTTAAIAAINPASPTKLVEEKEFSTGLKAESKPEAIVAGPDGNLWFADNGTTPAIGMINPGTHAIEEFPTEQAGSKPQGIAAGPDGNLWFTDTGTTKAIGKIDPSTHVIEEFATGGGSQPGGNNQPYGPWGIAAGADGNVWFTEGSGNAICRITTSGTITCFKEGLVASSKPNGLTAVPGSDKLWFTDVSGVNEVQELEINATENLGGTYKLSFGGKETGATGSGNLLSSAKGAGDVKRFPASGNTSCKRKAESKELKECNETGIALAEVGMRITGTGIPAETLITKIEGKTIFISNAAVSGAETNTTNINGGRVANVSTESGKFEVGQTVTGTKVSGTIFSVEEKEGKVTGFASTATPTGVEAGAALTASATNVVTNVTTSSGEFVKGETISGKGIPAGCTITAINTTQKTLTLSCTPTEAGTGVELKADLGASAVGSVIQEVLQKLTSIGSEGVGASGVGTTAPIKRIITFELPRGATDVEQISCNGAGLTGISPTCAVTTTTQGVPNALGSISTSSGAITRYPDAGLNRNQVGLAGGITNGPGGNVWFATGLSTAQKLGKFGISAYKLTVTNVGAGTGTVECNTGSGPEACAAEYPEGKVVKLSASAGSESEFREWSGACSGKGSCEVTMSEAKTVGAFFAHEKQVLTINQSGNGTVSSKPKGIKCAAACSQATAKLYKGTKVILTAKAGTGGEFEGWTTGAGTCTGKTTPCEVEMSKAQSLTAAFKPGKAIEKPQTLTLSKSGTGNGYGTVKATGLTCEADCTQTKVAYYGGTETPKFKAATTVTLTATAAFGSSFGSWSGCETVEGSVCKVLMSKAQSVTAQFDLKPTKVLSLAQSGNGTVSSKPKGIKCAAACSSATAALPESTVVILTAKAGTGGEFEGWTETAGTCTGKVSPCEVEMSKAQSLTAAFKPGKAIEKPQTLTLSKAGTGKGTVKATGLTCEADCTQTKVAYYGGTETPKFKAATTVTLTATSQAGSDPVSWTGCETVEGSVCKVLMSKAQSVTARFEE